MTYQDVLHYALKDYGDTVAMYASNPTRAAYENMCFWQEQVYAAAKDVVAYGADTVAKQ